VQKLSAAVGTNIQNLDQNGVKWQEHGMGNETERGAHFWNINSLEIKFKVEKKWLKMFCFSQTKPNYGMRDLDPVLEEITGNKLGTVGPLLDGT